MSNNSAPRVLTVGDGATVQMYSDRYAGTIIKVSATGHEVVWQEDKATRTDSNGMSDSQSYSYEPDPDGRTRIFTRRKLGEDRYAYVEKGQSRRDGSFLRARRNKYYDFGF